MNLPEVNESIAFTVPDVYDENDTILGWTGPNRNLRIFKHKFEYVDPMTMEPKQKLIAVKVSIHKNVIKYTLYCDIQEIVYLYNCLLPYVLKL